MDPGVGEHIALVTSVRLAAQGFAGFEEVVDAALALREVRALALVDAVGNPVDDERLGARVPQWAVDGVFLGVDDVETLFRRCVLGADD